MHSRRPSLDSTNMQPSPLDSADVQSPLPLLDSANVQPSPPPLVSGHPSIGYDYCVKTFQDDKTSYTADARSLAAITAKIAEAAANATAARIATLSASEKDARRRESLSVCAEVYSDAVDQLGEAAEDIARGEEEAISYHVPTPPIRSSSSARLSLSTHDIMLDP